MDKNKKAILTAYGAGVGVGLLWGTALAMWAVNGLLGRKVQENIAARVAAAHFASAQRRRDCAQ